MSLHLMFKSEKIPLLKITVANSLLIDLEFRSQSCVRFCLIVARFHFPGEPCLHRYIYHLEDYSGVCICSEFKHTVFFFYTDEK